MDQADFIPISVATLLPTNAVGLHLYQRELDSESLILYRDADFPLTMEDLHRLRNRGVHRLYITKEARGSYQRYLRKMATTSDPTQVPVSARAGALNEVLRDVLEASFNRNETDKTVVAAEKLGVLAADIITQDAFAVSDLFEVLHHDYATFTHSTNVAFYSAMLGAELGFDRKQIEQLTTGGLLHDLGKLEIDETILCKPGKLDDAEFRVIKTHPLIGFRRLARRDDLTEGQLMMTYQHHERLDGKGYPVGCIASDIHPWAKICSIVDVFEALTSHRPYRSPMSHARALEIQMRDAGTAFDPEILKCWRKIIQNDLKR
jgi:HD-GYP domain-containing protein (c-di-GMP phosphodiesterase class II)